MIRTGWLGNCLNVAVVILTLALPKTTWAETKAGDLELNVAASASVLVPEEPGFLQSPSAIYSASLQTSVGYFVTPHSEFDVAALFSRSGNNRNETSTFVGLLRYKYHFNTKGVVVPYLGPSVGGFAFDSRGNDEAGPLFGGVAGIKSFITERIAVTTEYDYLKLDVKGQSFDFHSIFVGLSYTFR